MKYQFILFILLSSQTVFCVNRDWIGGIGDWAVASNWSPAGIPDFNDYLTIPNGQATIFGATNAQAKGLIIQNGATVILNGSLQIDGSGTWGLQVIGTFKNLGGSLTVTNTILSDAIWVTTTGVFENSGTVDVSGAYGKLINNSNYFHNMAGGSISASTNTIGAGIYNSDSLINAGSISVSNTNGDGISNWTTGFLVNSGTFTVDATIGQSGFENAGTAENSGTMHIKNSANGFAGVYQLFTGTFTNSGTLDIDTNIDGDGISNFSGTSFTNTSSGIINISDIDCNCGASAVDNSGFFSNAGTINVTEGTTYISTNAIQNRDGGIFDNQGILYLEDSNFTRLVNAGSGTTFSNTGTITIPATTNSFGQPFSNYGSALFTNDGTLINEKQGSLVNDETATLINNGTIDSHFGLANYANFTNSPGALLQIDSFSFLNSTNFSGTSTGTTTNQGTIQVQNGFFGIQNNQDASFDNQGMISISNTLTSGLSNDAFGGTWNNTYFENSGTITINNTGGRGIYNFGNPEFLNSGSIAISNTVQEGIYNSYEAGTLFTNSGTINLGPSIGTNGTSSGIYNSAPFVNSSSGTINISSAGNHAIELWSFSFTNAGMVAINTSIAQAGIKLRNGATFDNQTGSDLGIDDTGGEAVFLNSGTFTNAGKVTFGPNLGADAILGPTGSFTNQNTGELWGLGGIDGYVFSNLGYFRPGYSPGQFSITGPYDHTNAIFDLEIAGNGGPAVPNGHDQLQINTGVTTLGGTLNVFLINGFTPTIGDSYIIVVCTGGCNGTFSTVNLPIDPTYWEVTYNPNNVILNYFGQPVAVEAGNNITICAGENASLNATATGGDGNYSFSWDNGLGGGPSHVVSPVTTTTYHVTVTDGFSHSAQDSVTVTVLSSPVVTISGDLEFCSGESTTLDAGPFNSYAWSTNENTQQITVTAPGTYSVTVTNANNCSDSDQVTVVELPAPLPAITGDLNICTGESTTLDAGTFSGYQWSTNETTQTIIVSTTGNYSVTVTDANGCSGSSSVTVNEFSIPTPSINGDPGFCTGESTTLDAGSYASYLWSTNETTQTIAVSAPGNYGVTVTDGNGCSGNTSVTVNEFSPPNPNITGDLTFCEGESTTLDAGSYSSYSWSTNQTTQTISVSAPGTYGVTVTDGNGCSGATATTVNEFPAPTPVISGALNFCPGESTLLDAGSYVSYQWSTNQNTQTIAVSAAGTYSVTVTDANGCSGTTAVTVIEFIAPVPVISGNTAFCTGESTILDAGSYASYNWSTNQTTQTITVSTSGTFSVTVTDGNGCSGSTSVVVNEFSPPTPNITGDLTFCSGESTLLDAGSYVSYNWSNNQNTQTIAVFAPGAYSVTVTDGNGCSGSTSVNVTELPVPTPIVSGDSDFCFGESTTLDAGTYSSYLWSTNATTQTISVSTPGAYSVTVTDGNGCSGSTTLTVTVLPAPTPNISGDTELCFGESTTLDAGTYSSYLWSTNATTQTIMVSIPGAYGVTVTDGNGCSGSATVNVNVFPTPVPNIAGIPNFCSGESTTLDAGAYSSYLWSNNATTQTIGVSTPGAYSVTVTDANGCSGSASVTVSEIPAPVPSISGDPNFCAGASTLLNVGTYSSYLWSTNETTQAITVSTGGTYGVTVTDGNGCSGSTSVTVNEFPVPSPEILGDLTFCDGESTTLDGGVYASYLWSSGESTQTITVTSTGLYGVTVTDNNGCSGSDQVTAIEFLPVEPQITGQLSICVGTQTILDAGNFSSYLWSTSETTQSITVSQAGTYGVTVTDGNGCTGFDQATVIVADSLQPEILGPSVLCSGETAQLNAGVFFSYQWSTNESTQTISVNSGGSYNVTVMDVNGCTGYDTFTLSEVPNPVPEIEGTAAFCQGENSVIGVTGTYTDYLWSTNEITPFIVVNSPGNYSITVTDNNGCMGSDQMSVTVLMAPSPGIAGNLTFCNGSSTLLDAGPFNSYQWSTGETGQTIEVTESGDYSVTVTDINGCEGFDQVTVTENAALQPQISGQLSFCIGSSTILDAGTFDGYLWSNGETTQTIIVTQPGDYSVTVTDINGCEGIDQVTVTENAALQPDINGQLSFCNGSSTILDAGIFDGYLWSNGETTQTITVTTPGNYSVTVTDGNGCEGTDQVTVTENAELQPQISGALNFCYGTSTVLDAGTFDNYLWSNGETTQTITVTGSGDYAVTVMDNSGCEGSDQVTVTENLEVQPQISGQLSFCTGDSTTLDAGIFNSYLWSTGETTPSITVTESGDYSITVTDSNGCEGTDQVTVSENAELQPQISGAFNFCSGAFTTLDAGIFDSYLWSNGETTPSITVGVAGDYSVTVTDNSGCEGTDGVSVTENAPVQPQISGQLVFCSGDSTTLDAGTFDSYQWSNGETTQTITVTESGDYSVTVSDSNGCEGEDLVVVSENIPLTPEITGTLNFCAGDSSTLDAGVFDAYLWSTGQTTPTIIVTETGDYSVTVTDNNGCDAVDQVNVMEYTEVLPQISGQLSFCIGAFTVLDAGIFDSYLWSNGETTQTITVT
ncbi:MAG: hypothetical protein H6563_00005, partial [Lewinellaceae bacterium]|nr:hypothetical protein [Lewinellaceae bacterium]